MRGVAAEVVPHLDVMTRENSEALLPPGTDLATCTQGNCEVELGRQVGAKYVCSGDIIRFGKAMKVSLKLHATDSGKLLRSVSASAKEITAPRG